MVIRYPTYWQSFLSGVIMGKTYLLLNNLENVTSMRMM